MREDLNKVLCERERNGSKRKFRNNRHQKKFNAFDDDGEEIRIHESMKYRYDSYTERKAFSENLKPLKGIIRKSIGRKWDSFFSELCKTFNMDSVINKHILEHLYQYVKLNLIVKNGDLFINDGYWIGTKLSDSHFEFYVDPRDGIIKLNYHRKTYRQHQREQRLKAIADELKIYRQLDENTAIGLVNGIWYLFDIVKIDKKKIYGFIRDQFNGKLIDDYKNSYEFYTKNFYHTNKRAANKKLLRSLGL